MAAASADRDRLAAHQCAGRHHQFHHLRPQPAVACVRCRQGQGQSDGAAGPDRRKPHGARRTHLRARRHHVRDRRRGRAGIARRHHGRRGDRVLGSHHRCADRVGGMGRAQHRPDRPQARHQLRRALSLRARRRPGLHAARARAGNPDGARSLRRNAVRQCDRGRAARRRAGHRFPARYRGPAGRSRGRPARAPARAGAAWLLRRRAGQEREDRAAVVAPGRARQARYRRGDRAHHRGRPHPRDALRSR